MEVGAVFGLAAGFTLGCGGGAPAAASSGDAKDQSCRARLAPRAAPPGPSAASPIRSAGESQIIVHLEVALAPMLAQLETRVQKRLATGRFGIGPGGTVTYSVDRGALSVATTASAFVIETPVRAQAEACHGNGCYASCTPQAVVRAEVPLMLRPDYAFSPTRVSLRFTEPCKVRALGGFLTIDLTPTIESQLEPELRKVGRRIDEQLPNFRAEAQQVWHELSLPRELPLGACLELRPSRLVQGPLRPSRSQLQARFAVLATPELRWRCSEPATPPAESPLPPLRVDPGLPEDGALQLGMVSPLSSLASSLSAPGAKLAARGSDVDVALTLASEVCGELAFGASPDFSGEGQKIGLAQPVLTSTERQRLLDQGLDPNALVRELTASARVTPLLSVQGFREGAPALASAQSSPKLELSARVVSTRPAGAAARGDELVAWLEAKGSVTLRPK
jgi:hypothetical protein